MSGDKIVTGIKLSAETRQRLERLQQSSELSSEAQKDIEVDLQRGLLSSKTMKLMMTQEASGKPVFVNTKDLSVVMNRAQNTVKKEEDTFTKQRKEARLEFLKIKQEERVYNQMIYGKDSNPNLDKDVSMGSQMSTFRYQMSIGFNMIFSIGATFGMAYYIAIHLNFIPNQAMIIALVCAIIIMVIEMILFIMRSVQIEESLETPLTAQKSSMAKFRSGALAPDPHFKPDLNFEPPENKEVDKILRGEGPEEIEDASELAETSLQQKKDQ